MPTRPWTRAEIEDSKLLADAASMLRSCDDEDATMVAFLALGAAAEPFAKRQKQQVGMERLSLARLQREAAQQGMMGDDTSKNIYQRFGFRLEDLPSIINAFNFPMKNKSRGGHAFTGEEAVLILLRRFRSTCPLLELTQETGRNISALSEIINWTVEDIRAR
jgi:nuclease HARBI1